MGVGEMIRTAVRQPGVRRLVVGLGGSATNDAGAGILQALGWRLLDSTGNDIGPGGIGLHALHRVRPPRMSVIPDDITVTIAVDVDNPLVGPGGASAVFGPQKGADPSMVARLDCALSRFRDCVGRDDFPGAGAAGGAAFGLRVAFPGARFRPGIELVMETVGFDGLLEHASLVVTTAALTHISHTL
ncbi:MAG: glycerate kinase, partial [Armatimonadaceae bacterium]